VFNKKDKKRKKIKKKMVRLQIPGQDVNSHLVNFSRAVEKSKNDNYIRNKQRYEQHSRLFKRNSANAKTVPHHRFDSNPSFTFQPKNSRVDTSSYKRNVSFFNDPYFDNTSTSWKDTAFLKDKRLSLAGYTRTSMRDPIPISRQVFTPSHVGALTGGAGPV
jgi:hypothetical protein